jgi:thymidylate kinase
MFIVLEGLDGVGKTTTVKQLTERLGARLTRTPPDVMRSFRDEFDSNGSAERRKTYYEVGNFVAGEEARVAIEHGEKIVCDRYFCSTHAYIMGRAAKSVEALPTEQDPQWPQWPTLLQRPTHMFVLTLPHEVRLARLADRVHRSGGSEPETAEEKLLRESKSICDAINAAFERLGCVSVSAEGSTSDVVDRIIALITEGVTP